MSKFCRLALCIILSAWAAAAWAGEYDFTIPEAKKKDYELGGRVEFRYLQHRLNDQSSRYRLNYYKDNPGAYTEEWRPLVELKGSYRYGKAQIHLLTHHEYDETYQGGEWINRIYEGYVSLKPSANFTFEAGKKSFSCGGKGYAWNPAGFINRPKDPDDPELNLEGYTALGVDYIKSFGRSSLKNLAVTALLLPVLDGWKTPSWAKAAI